MKQNNISPAVLKSVNPVMLKQGETEAAENVLSIYRISNAPSDAGDPRTLAPSNRVFGQAHRIPPQRRSDLNAPAIFPQSTLASIFESEDENVETEDEFFDAVSELEETFFDAECPPENQNMNSLNFSHLLQALRGQATQIENNQQPSCAKGFFVSVSSNLSTDVNIGSGVNASATSGVELKISNLEIQTPTVEESGKLTLIELSNSATLQLGGVDHPYLPTLPPRNSTTTTAENNTRTINKPFISQDTFEYKTTDNGTLYSSEGTTLFTPTQVNADPVQNQTLTISNNTLTDVEGRNESNQYPPINNQPLNNTARSSLNSQLPIEVTAPLGSLLPQLNVTHRNGLRFELYSQDVSDVNSMRISAFTEMRLNMGIHQLITKIYQRLGSSIANFNFGRPYFYTSNQIQQQTSGNLGFRTLYLWDSSEDNPYRAFNISMLLQGAQLIGQASGWMLGNLVLSPVAGMSLGGLLSSWSSITLMRWSPFCYFQPNRNYTTGINVIEAEMNVLDVSGRQHFTMTDSVGGNLRAGILAQHEVGFISPAFRRSRNTTDSQTQDSDSSSPSTGCVNSDVD